MKGQLALQGNLLFLAILRQIELSIHRQGKHKNLDFPLFSNTSQHRIHGTRIFTITYIWLIIMVNA